jgi:hypothetical protein
MAKAPSRRPSRRTAPVPTRLRVRLTLREIAPAVWREISVPDSYSLEQLHRCIQLAFDWLDYHLYEFQIGRERFERPDPDGEGKDANAVRLADLKLKIGDSFTYFYDMGDGWAHDVEVRSLEPVDLKQELDSLAYVVGGARAAPPEDVGGPPGYERLVRAFHDPSDAESADLLEWAGPGFDPELFDRRASNHAMMLASAWGVV